MISPMRMKNGIASKVKLFTPSIIMRTITVSFVPLIKAEPNVERSRAKVTGTFRNIRRKNPPSNTMVAKAAVLISMPLRQ